MKYGYLILLLGLLNSCQQETEQVEQSQVALKVNFNFTIKEDRAPAKVDFNIEQPNGEYYEWDFGDGKTSSLQNPQHTFMEGGTYEVKLTGRKGDKELSVTKVVTIKPAIKSFSIQSIIIHKIPARDGEKNWDGVLQGTYPDVFFQFLGKNNNVLYELETPQADLQESQLPHEINFPYIIDNLDDTYSFKFWDSDMWEENDYMGGFELTPSKMNMETTTFRFVDKNLEVEIKGTWNE